MTEFLSPQWFTELDTRTKSARPPVELTFTLEQVIEDTPDLRYQLRIADGAVSLDLDPNGPADATVRTSRATAQGIHRGEISAERAFLNGDLRIGGDITKLMACRGELAELGTF